MCCSGWGGYTRERGHGSKLHHRGFYSGRGIVVSWWGSLDNCFFYFLDMFLKLLFVMCSIYFLKPVSKKRCSSCAMKRHMAKPPSAPSITLFRRVSGITHSEEVCRCMPDKRHTTKPSLPSGPVASGFHCRPYTTKLYRVYLGLCPWHTTIPVVFSV